MDLPNGGKSEARFNIFRWPADTAPGGVRIFACQHLTPEAVWIPELKTHANGARGLVRVEVLTGKPQDAAAQLGRLIDQGATETADGVRVASGGSRADFLFYDPTAFAQRYLDGVRQGAPAGGAVAIVIATDDLAKARAIPGAVVHGDGVSVPASAANGAILNFVKA